MMRVHWYHVPPVLLAMGLGVVLLNAQTVGTAPTEVARHVLAFQGLLALLVVWVGWVTPLIARMAVPDGPPRRVVARKRWLIWLPTFTAGMWILATLGLTGIQIVQRQLLPDVLLVTMLLVGVLLATMPVSAAVARRYAERYRAFIRQSQHCFECGYNLMGNPELEQCPECGKAAPLESDD